MLLKRSFGIEHARYEPSCVQRMSRYCSNLSLIVLAAGVAAMLALPQPACATLIFSDTFTGPR